MRRQLMFVFAALTCCGPAAGEPLSERLGPSSRDLVAGQARAPQARIWDPLTAALTQGRGEVIFTIAPDLAAEGVPGAGNVLLLVVGDSRDLCARFSSPPPPWGADIGSPAADQAGIQLALWIREVDATGQAHFPSLGSSFEVDPAGDPRPWATTWAADQPGAMRPGRHAVARLLAPTATPRVAPRVGCRPCAAAAKQRPPARPNPSGRLTVGHLQVSDTSKTPAALEVDLSLSPVGPHGETFSHTFAASWCPALRIAPVPQPVPAL